jgi:hypothetical protein
MMPNKKEKTAEEKQDIYDSLVAYLDSEVKSTADYFVAQKGNKYEAAIFLSTVTSYLVSRIRIDNGDK